MDEIILDCGIYLLTRGRRWRFPCSAQISQPAESPCIELTSSCHLGLFPEEQRLSWASLKSYPGFAVENTVNKSKVASEDK